MTGRMICRVTANSLIGGVRVKPWAATALGWVTLGVANVLLRRLDARQGGLWVGGALSVYEDGMRFEPNALNRAIQDGGLVTELRWPEVVGISRRFGFLTGIIEVAHAHGTQAFRCFGAKRVAAAMTTAWRSATP
ncbi:MAG TPA: hypothetical protein VGG29_07285 [Caulobacteraceae bacterium]|jgi:hypothetical protein